MDAKPVRRARPIFGWFLGSLAGGLLVGTIFGTFFVPPVPPGVTICTARAFATIGAFIEGAFIGSLAGAGIGLILDDMRCRALNASQSQEIF